MVADAAPEYKLVLCLCLFARVDDHGLDTVLINKALISDIYLLELDLARHTLVDLFGVGAHPCLAPHAFDLVL